MVAGKIPIIVDSEEDLKGLFGTYPENLDKTDVSYKKSLKEALGKIENVERGENVIHIESDENNVLSAIGYEVSLHLIRSGFRLNVFNSYPDRNRLSSLDINGEKNAVILPIYYYTDHNENTQTEPKRTGVGLLTGMRDPQGNHIPAIMLEKRKTYCDEVEESEDSLVSENTGKSDFLWIGLVLFSLPFLASALFYSNSLIHYLLEKHSTLFFSVPTGNSLLSAGFLVSSIGTPSPGYHFCGGSGYHVQGLEIHAKEKISHLQVRRSSMGTWSICL